MAAGPDEDAGGRPRPRPRAGAADATSTNSSRTTSSRTTSARAASDRAASDRAASGRDASGRDASGRDASGRDAKGRFARRKPASTGALVRQQQAQGQQMAVAAGNAVVTVARVGRLLGRTGWRLAKQIPVVEAVETQAVRIGETLVTEFARLLDAPGSVFGGGTPEEQRAMTLLHQASNDPEPLRSAMSELLERSDGDRVSSTDYLYGSIVSQLVPDEARILAALTGGREFAVVDVVVKPAGRGASRVELANTSTVGAAAKVALLDNTGTYLTRLHTFGLVEFGQAGEELDGQFDALHEDPEVQRAKANAGGRAKIVRKRVVMSRFGSEFWTACAPRPGTVGRLDTGK